MHLINSWKQAVSFHLKVFLCLHFYNYYVKNIINIVLENGINIY